MMNAVRHYWRAALGYWNEERMEVPGECQRLGRTVKWPSGRDGRTVEGIYVACLHVRCLVPIKPRNAGDGRPASTRNIGSEVDRTLLK